VDAEQLAAELEEASVSGGRGGGGGRQRGGGESHGGRGWRGGRGRGGGPANGGRAGNNRSFPAQGRSPSNGVAENGRAQWPQHPFPPPPPPPSHPYAPGPQVMANSVLAYTMPGGMPVPLVMLPAYPHGHLPHAENGAMQPMVVVRNSNGMAMHSHPGLHNPGGMRARPANKSPPSPMAISPPRAVGSASIRPPPPPDAAAGMTPHHSPSNHHGIPMQLEYTPPSVRRGLMLPTNDPGSPGNGVRPRSAGWPHAARGPHGPQPQLLHPYPPVGPVMYVAIPAHQAQAAAQQDLALSGMQPGAAHAAWETSPQQGREMFPGPGAAVAMQQGVGTWVEGPMHGRGGRGRGGRDWQRNVLENGAARGGRFRHGPHGDGGSNGGDRGGPLGTFHRHLHNFDMEHGVGRGGVGSGGRSSVRRGGNSHNHHRSSSSNNGVSNNHQAPAPAPKTPDRDGGVGLQALDALNAAHAPQQ
jgi:hypothetical protein